MTMPGQYGNEEILEFIFRRFPKDSNWLDGNCYFFAKILESAFEGVIYYDPIAGHFLFKQGKFYYDWAGAHQYPKEVEVKFENWRQYMYKDPIHYSRVMQDCAS